MRESSITNVEEKVQATDNENSADVGSMYDLIGH